MQRTASQNRIYRAVHGAACNVAHAHPDWKVTQQIARSIAKRATGTLTAGWPEVLAARSMPSDRRRVTLSSPPSRGPSLRLLGRRSPLPALWKQLSRMVWQAKRDGKTERVETLIEILKIIAAMQIEKNKGAGNT